MPNFKKNAMNQILFPMVDKTDFATIESGITASDFNSAATKKFFGVNHGVSDAFTSGTISKATTLVHSGIFAQTLKAAECNYDYLVVRFTHPSCADQILVFQPEEIDPSDMYSLLSDFQSDFASRVPKAVANNSQLSDLASDLRSVMIVMSGILSDVYSNLAAGVALNASALSDVGSNVWAHTTGAATASRVLLNLSRISDVYSLLSDTNSDLRSYLAGISATLSDTYSQLSDFRSNLGSLVTTTGIQLNASSLSDLRSAIAAGPAATITASDISDIASAVWANATGAATASRVLLNLSRVSDIYSLLSDVGSDLRSLIGAGVNVSGSDMSDLRSAIAGITASLGASDISDIASAVWANAIGARVDSRMLLNQSRISDTYSLLSDFYSDFLSKVPKAPATASALSDAASDLRSLIGAGVPLNASALSDVGSNVWAHTTGAAVSSRVLLNLSRISDVYSLLSDLQSDFQSRVPKAVATNSQLSDIGSDLRSFLVALSGLVSDVDSALTSQFAAGVASFSDIKSAVGNISVTLTASDISDIASATAAAIPAIGTSDISNIASAVWAHTVGARVDSRVLLNQSRISDVYSLLSDFQSDLTSRVPKAVANYSQLSDLASDLRSYLAGLSGTLSDVYSNLAAGVNLGASDMSDLRSAINAGGLTASSLSDIASAVWADAIGARVDSRLLVNQSRVSDIYSLLSDVGSDFQSRVPKAVATNSQLSDLASDIKSAIAVGNSAASDVYSLLSDLNSDLASRVNAEVVDVLRTDLIPDSYPADGAQPTIAQALLAVLQFLQERSVSGTTVTVRKPDGTTAAMTFTLNDGTSPTSISRSG